jgi:hypothetical protein
MNKKSDSNKVLSHIDEAKNWLDEAKEGYTQSNRVRGEINLNLAQAEVKYAWELSRRQNVTQHDQAVPALQVKKYLPAVAAAIFILVGLAGGIYWRIGGVKTDTPVLTAKNKNIPVKEAQLTQTVNQTTPVVEHIVKAVAEGSGNSVANRSLIATKKTKTVRTSVQTVALAKSKPENVKTEVIKNIKTVVKADETKLSVMPTAVEKAEKTMATDVGTTESQESKNVASIKRDFVPNTAKLSVASLVIDEEALTKEASYSLKNGK